MSDQENQMWCIGCWSKLEHGSEACEQCGRKFCSTNPATYYCRSVSYPSAIDLHVVYLSLMLGLPGLLIPWPFVTAIVLYLAPQPMIATHAITSYMHKPDEGKWNRAYILVNEAFVMTFALTILALGWLLRA